MASSPFSDDDVRNCAMMVDDVCVTAGFEFIDPEDGGTWNRFNAAVRSILETFYRVDPDADGDADFMPIDDEEDDSIESETLTDEEDDY